MTTYIKPPRSEDCHWRSDTPPEPGWYPASNKRSPSTLRYWNGKHWSFGVFDSKDAYYAGWAAQDKAHDQHAIRWCEPWWPKATGGKA